MRSNTDTGRKGVLGEYSSASLVRSSGPCLFKARRMHFDIHWCRIVTCGAVGGCHTWPFLICSYGSFSLNPKSDPLRNLRGITFLGTKIALKKSLRKNKPIKKEPGANDHVLFVGHASSMIQCGPKFSRIGCRCPRNFGLQRQTGICYCCQTA